MRCYKYRTWHASLLGIACPEKRLYGVQFHPEVDLTTNGRKMFDNFLFRISGCSSSYTMSSREQMCIDEIRRTVGDKKVLVGQPILLSLIAVAAMYRTRKRVGVGMLRRNANLLPINASSRT